MTFEIRDGGQRGIAKPHCAPISNRTSVPAGIASVDHPIDRHSATGGGVIARFDMAPTM